MQRRETAVDGVLTPRQVVVSWAGLWVLVLLSVVLLWHRQHGVAEAPPAFTLCTTRPAFAVRS
jgi:hypothetical protein